MVMHAVPGLVAPAFISNKNHAHLLQAGTKGTITAAGRRVCSSPTCYVNTLILPPRRLPARPGICCEIRRRFARRILATGRLISFRRKIKNQLFLFLPRDVVTPGGRKTLHILPHLQPSESRTRPRSSPRTPRLLRG